MSVKNGTQLNKILLDFYKKKKQHRNRLENNTEHWNALFVSLRELAEWTVKKEAELENMGPIGGDEATIRKQQVRIQSKNLKCTRNNTLRLENKSSINFYFKKSIKSKNLRQKI